MQHKLRLALLMFLVAVLAMYIHLYHLFNRPIPVDNVALEGLKLQVLQLQKRLRQREVEFLQEGQSLVKYVEELKELEARVHMVHVPRHPVDLSTVRTMVHNHKQLLDASLGGESTTRKDTSRQSQRNVAPQSVQQQPHTAQQQPHTAQQQPHTAQQQPHTAQQQPHVAQQQPRNSQLHPNQHPLFDGDTCVILLCYGRAHYLKRTLESLQSALKTQMEHSQLTDPKSQFCLFFSQDGKKSDVSSVVDEYVARFRKDLGLSVKHVYHQRGLRPRNGYFALADHFKWGLDELFSGAVNGVMPRRVIVIEDDLLLAPDFFELMGAMSTMLDDPAENLLAVSAWNDHGQTSFVGDPSQLHRTDFFPGLGWMLNAALWEEIGPKWPEAYWDDWLRSSNQRKGRQVIHPEVSRTYTIGKSGGASSGQFYDRYLSNIRLNSEFTPFTTQDHSMLTVKGYDEWLRLRVANAKEATSLSDLTDGSTSHRWRYSNFGEYAGICKKLGLMDDIKENVPRGAYKGVVPVKYKGVHPLYIYPAKYDP